MEKTIEDKAVKRLRMHYNIHVAAAAALFILVWLRVIDFSEHAARITVVAERYALMGTLIIIPAALKLFAEMLKKFSQKTNRQAAIRAYQRAYFTRLYMLGAATAANIALFAVSRNANFMWLAVVLFIVYFFCRPSYPELMALTETKKDEKTPDKQPDTPESH